MATDYRLAATNAKQMVRTFWDLQNLAEALEEISNGATSIENHRRTLAELKAGIEAQQERMRQATASAEAAEANARKLVQEKILEEHEQLRHIQALTAEHLRRRDEAQAQADEASKRLDDLRAALR